MRGLPAALVSEVAKECQRLGHLIELSLATTLRYTDVDLDVLYKNAKYYSRGIKFDNAQYSLLPKVDNLSFEVDNVDLAFSAFIMSQEIRGKKCVIYRAAFDDYLNVIGATPLFIGYLDRVEVSQQRARIEIVNHFIKWNTMTPRRIHAVSCPWSFKDTTTCRYAGVVTSCDKSWDACSAMSNTPNFGGYRFLTSLATQSVSWGRP